MADGRGARDRHGRAEDAGAEERHVPRVFEEQALLLLQPDQGVDGSAASLGTPPASPVSALGMPSR